MARKYFAGRDPIGARFKHGGGDASQNPNPWISVVGVVADVRHNGITGMVKPKFYLLLAQWHLRSANGSTSRNMTLVVRSTGNPLALASPIRAEVQRMDGEVPVAAVRTMEDVVAALIATPRLTGWLLGFFAGLALLLAAIAHLQRAVVRRQPAPARDWHPGRDGRLGNRDRGAGRGRAGLR